MGKSKVISLKSPTAPKEDPVQVLVGASGTQFFSGFFNISDADEYSPDLKGSKALTVYNRMRRNDAQVKLALLALMHPIVNAHWSIEPAGDEEKDDPPTPQEEEAAKLISQWWFDDEFQWEKGLRQILSLFWAGFSMFEKLYAYDGKYIVPRKLAQRLQSTIVEWDVQDERLMRVRQYIPGGITSRNVWIPSEKLVLFTFDQEGDDFRGQSPLRSAYKHWFFKDTFYRIQGIQIERWAVGIPRIEQTDPVVNKTSRDAAIEAAKNMRAHEQGYYYVPKGFKIDLVESGAGKMIDAMPAIQHHDAGILKCIMAQFLELGMTETGARSLGDTLKDMYLMGLSYTANYVCEVIRTQVFKELTEWNWGPTVRPPHLVFKGIQPVDFKLLAEAYSQLVTSGAVEADDKLEAYFRNTLGLPPKDDATARKKAPPAAGTVPGNPGEEPGQEPEVAPPEKGKPEEKPKKKLTAAETASPGMEADTWIHFWRPLRETEENVAFREIVGRLDDSKEKIVRATREIRGIVVDELAKQVKAAVDSKDPSLIQQIDYSTETGQALVVAVEPILSDLVLYGRQQVARELGKKKLASKKDLADFMKKYLDAKANQFSEISLDKLVDEARTLTSDFIRTETYSASAVTDALEAFSENTVRNSAGYVVNEAFGFGRTQEAEERKSEIEYAEYSAIIDGNTCGPCEALDGEEFSLDDPGYVENTPPLKDCEGGSQCRCIWVYVSKA